MRSATAPETAVLASQAYQITLRVKVANGSGTMKDLSSWVDSVTIDQDVDQPVSGCSVFFRRDFGATISLSPLRTDSTLNRLDDNVTYSPQLDLNRSITVELAATALGAAVVAGDYKLLFKGTIDIVNFESNPVSIECRDLGAPLVDRWIEAEASFGSGGGTAIQTVMQNIIDSVFGGGIITLYVPVSPGFNIVTYQQQKMSVMDALQDLVQLIGWDVRYKWDDGTSAFRLTLSQPDRAKTVPDYTFAPSKYIAITRLNLDLTNIRNVITVSYRDGPNLGNRNSVTVTDTTSINKYGRRFLGIQEPDVSPIDTSSEATSMANAALADLKEPKAEQEVHLPFFWPVELGDLHRYSDNDIHYDTNQDLSVVEIKHQISANSHRTNIKVRGTPIGQYLTWLGRSGPGGIPIGPGGQAYPPRAIITPLNTEADETTWDLEFNAVYGSGGGGTNLTYTIHAKTSYGVGSDALLASGNASTLPLDLAIDREPSYDRMGRFTLTDVATGMTDQELFTIDAYNPFTDQTGRILTGVKFIGDGTTPALSNVNAFWNGTNSIVGTDTAGRVTLNKTTTASTAGANPHFRVTFDTAYAVAPIVVLTGNTDDATSDSGWGYGVLNQIVVTAVTTTYFEVGVRARLLQIGSTTAQIATVDYVVVGR